MRNVARCLLMLILVPAAAAGDWPQWRGPAGNGSADEKNLPESCDPATARWSTALPGASHATPVIVGERLFLTAIERASKGVTAICLNPADGAIRWQRRLGDDIKAPQNNGATPSPVTDGKTVWFLLGSGLLAALDVDGKPLWQRQLAADYGNLATKFGYSSSPLLWRGTLYVQLLRRDRPYSATAGVTGPLDSLVLALDPATGREKWRHVRPSAAVDESRESYTTPVACEAGSGELLIQGGDCVSGHDPATGVEHWRCDYNPERETIWRVIPSPVMAGDRIVVGLPRGGRLLALKPGASGPVAMTDALWSYDERTSDSGTPLFYQGLIYVLQSDKNDPWNRKGKSSTGIFLLVIDPATGQEAGRCQIDKGEVVVVAAGATPRILSRASYDDGPACATIAAANGRLFIRTASKLTCFGK
jgi:outer membrane protein assembly factor BamB